MLMFRRTESSLNLPLVPSSPDSPSPTDKIIPKRDSRRTHLRKHSSETKVNDHQDIRDLEKQRKWLDEEKTIFENYRKAEEQTLSQEKQQLMKDVARLESELNTAIKGAQEKIRKEREDFESEKKERSQFKRKIENWPRQLKIRVGNDVYFTSPQTLTTIPDSFFASALLSYMRLASSSPDKAVSSFNQPMLQEEEGEGEGEGEEKEKEVFIDRDGTHFAYILNYLRDKEKNRCILPRDKLVLKQLKAEAEFYQLREMVILIDKKLLNIKRKKEGMENKRESNGNGKSL